MIAAPTLTRQEQQNLANAVDCTQMQSVSQIWPTIAKKFGSLVVLNDPHGEPKLQLTFTELAEQIKQFAAGVQALGMAAGEKVALFSDNQPRWLIADQGLMTAGIVDAVRGSQADGDELAYILNHSDSVALIVQDQATLDKLANAVKTVNLRFIALLSDEEPHLETALETDSKLLNFQQIMALGAAHAWQPVVYDRQQLATLMYTSGTSGQPKGVMLSHHNLLSQITGACSVLSFTPGQVVLSILPIWHCYERTFEYFVLSQGCSQVYTNIRYLKKDLQQYQPNYMVGVPRLWESIYEGVQKQFREQPASKQKLINFFFAVSQRYIQAKRAIANLDLANPTPNPLTKLIAIPTAALLWPLHRLADALVYKQVRAAVGGNIDFIVSGGGSIADHLEDFYEIVGITILGGYGLTETSPITHVRRPWRNLRGADGEALPGTETQIVDLENSETVPLGQQGLVLIRGPQVMQGYYKNPTATAKAIDAAGWFNTGDLGKVTPAGDLIITGRAKDTIVLTNGENIEPQPIEDACIRSPYIDQLMLVGQDEKVLGALIVPNFEALQKWAALQGQTLATPDQPSSADGTLTLTSPAIQNLFRQELNREVKDRPGYRPDDKIGPFTLLDEPFSIENGLLTQTLKIRRPVVTERYRGMIDAMYA